jgi:hypothetical protein
MRIIRAVVFGATLTLALSPLAAFAADTSTEHSQAELANGFAQLDQTQQQVADMQTDANKSAANERMIAVLRSQAMRERQLNLVANANAMESIAASLANAARAQGDVNARNEVAIAQIRAARLVAVADANVANAIAIGRIDEIANANAQAKTLHQLADFLTGQMTETNISNDKQIAQQTADEIHTPKIVEQQNGAAMGANELLASDVALQAGTLAATSVMVSESADAADLLDHALSSLQSDKVRAGVGD